MTLCEHKRLITLCPECRPRITTAQERLAAQLARLDPKWAEIWHRLRRECHGRLRRFLNHCHGQPWDAELYYAAYDRPASENLISAAEDLGTFNGGFRRGYLKFLDVTLNGERLQGYNGRSEWRLLQARTAGLEVNQIDEMLSSGRLRIHGGTATFSAQQRASPSYEKPALRQVVERICFGADGRTPDELKAAELAERLHEAARLGKKVGAPPSLSLCSKLAHVYDPQRWAILNTRSNADMATLLGIEVEHVDTPERYLQYCEALEAYRQREGLPDLDMVDIRFSGVYRELHESHVG